MRTTNVPLKKNVRVTKNLRVKKNLRVTKNVSVTKNVRWKKNDDLTKTNAYQNMLICEKKHTLQKNPIETDALQKTYIIKNRMREKKVRMKKNERLVKN